MNNHDDIVNFLRKKSHDEVKEYAKANGIDTQGKSKDYLDHKVADVLSKKYKSGSGNYSPRTSRFTASNASESTVPGEHVVRNQYMTKYIPAATDMRGRSPASRAWQEKERQIGARIRAEDSNAREQGPHHWANQYGSGIVKGKDERGISPASRAWQRAELSEFRRGATSLPQASHMASQHGSYSDWSQIPPEEVRKMGKSPRSDYRKANGKMDRWANQYGSGEIPKDEDCRGKPGCYHAATGKIAYRSKSYDQANARDEDDGETNWLELIKECTEKTDLNAVECAVELGHDKRHRHSKYRPEVLASAEKKLGGKSIQEVMGKKY